MATYTPTLKTNYREQIVPALMKEFGYKSIMQVPRLQKIVVNQGMGQAVADKKLIEVAGRGALPHHRSEGRYHQVEEGHFELQAP